MLIDLPKRHFFLSGLWTPVLRALQAGLVPVIYGDVVFDQVILLQVFVVVVVVVVVMIIPIFIMLYLIGTSCQLCVTRLLNPF